MAFVGGRIASEPNARSVESCVILRMSTIILQPS